MKNYLKFTVALFGVVISLVASSSLKAKEVEISDGVGVCDPSTATCGTASDGNAITGKFREL